MEESRPTGCCGGCCKTFCNEFNKRKFSFNYFDPRAFFECQWRIPHLLYILIRFLMFLYSMFGFIIFAIFYPDVMMRYFTIWSYLLLVIHLGLAAFLTLKRYKHWQPPVNVQPTPKAEMNVNTNMNLNTNANSTDLNTERHVDDGTGPVQNRNNRNTSVVVGNRNKLSDTPHKRGVDNQSYELVEITTTNPSSNNSPNINIKNNNNNNNNKSNNNHNNNNNNNTDDNNVNNNSNNERRHTHAIKWDDTATQHAKESVMNHRLEDSFERSGMQFSDQYGPTNVDEYQFQKSGKVDGTDSIFYRLRLATNRHLSSHLKIRNMSVDDITGFSTALHYKLSWMLYSVTSVTAPVVTIIYFATIYPKNETTGHIGIHDWNIHILNSVFVAIDQLLSARPVRILHGYLSVLFGGCYIVFSVLYWCLDRRNNVVYDILDWNNPELAIGCCIGLVFLFLFIHFLYFVLFRFKLCLAYRAT